MNNASSLTLLAPTDTSLSAPKRPIRVLGIDLGTTNSTVAEIFSRPVEPVVARCLEVDQKTNEGNYTHVLVPSVVAVGPSGAVVGEGAKRLRSQSGKLQLRRNKNLFFECKNEMGLERTYHLAPEGYRSPPQIASQVLRFLCDAATTVESTVPSRTIVTVPASFQAAQRKATLDAASAAGLELEPGDLLDEPVAAFIDFIVSQRSAAFDGVSGSRRLLVFDFGGGTCDVAVFEVSFDASSTAPTISPLAVSRYHRLGGGDIDTAIVHKILIPQVVQQNGLGQFDLSFDDKKNFIEPALLSVAEALKIGLCSEIRRLEAFGKYPPAGKSTVVKAQPGLHTFRTSTQELILQSPKLTAAEFEQILAPFLEEDLLYTVDGEYTLSCSIFAPITDAIYRAGLKPDQVDFCLLVGGSSLIPQIATAVGRHFARAKVLAYDDPVDAQTAIARGAAYHAWSLAMCGHGLVQPATHDDIAINTTSGLIPLIKRGTLLPAGASCDLAVPESNDFDPCRVRVEIFSVQGENRRILFKTIWEIPEWVSKGDPLKLTAGLDENQVLSVELRLAKSLDAEPFLKTIENPLTYVRNPLRERLKIDEIEEDIRTGRVPNGSIPDRLVELANGYQQLGQREKALEYLRRALQIKGQPDAYILNKMGIICGELGDFGRQEKLYRQAAEASDWAIPLFNLAFTEFKQNKHVEASETIHNALKRTREAPYLVLAGRIADANGKTTDRERYCEEARDKFQSAADLDDFAIGWAVELGRLLRDKNFLNKYEDEWRKRKTGSVGDDDDEGLLPMVGPGGMI